VLLLKGPGSATKMFASAFKSFSSNITSNYEVAKQPSTTIGVWTVFKGQKKNVNTEVSVFTFDRKSLDISSNGFGARATSATSVRKVQDEVVERLKKEASSLARLRHPSVLQLVEPVEETRNGGLIFATEPVLCSLATALAQKDRSGRRDGRTNPRATLDNDGAQSADDLDLDELEIQKGLLQVAKGLEFLHDSAKLVHGNLNPEAIIINAKSDWKISGLSFAGPPNGAEGHQAVPQISLSEVLYHDARIPRMVQLDLDYTSPDFVLDNNINPLADIFSLGLVILACYRESHRSPLETHGNQSTYKKLFSNASNVPSSSNNYLSERALPSELNVTLPRMLARRPAQRMSANEFQQSQYFDNILVNTMRFLDAFPAKTPAEKTQFMKGLGRVMPQFPPSILGKKILSVLLDEMKDPDLLPLIMQNIFQIIKAISKRKAVVSEKILPRMKEVLLAKSKSEERDTSKEAALLAVLNNIQLIADNTTAKQFKDDLLPIVHSAMESSTHALADAALQTLPAILPLLDFSTVKNDLFPVVASVFTKTNSLSIKIRGLEALSVLCGSSSKETLRSRDDLSGKLDDTPKDKSVSSLDKFTMQEKIVPLLKGIKTKEPAVMMAALKVFRQVGSVVDTEVLALEVMPILWSFALGPLLDLPQFQAFMDLIKALSAKIEREQIRKLQELSSSRPMEQGTSRTAASNGTGTGSGLANPPDDFAKLVLGSRGGEKDDIFAGALSDGQRLVPTMAWSSSKPAAGASSQSFASMPALQPQQPMSRSITPDVTTSAFPSLQPTSSASSIWATSPPLAPMQNHQQSRQAPLPSMNAMKTTAPSMASPGIGWQLPPPPKSGISNPGFSPGIAPPTMNSMQTSAWSQPNHNNAGMSASAMPVLGRLGGVPTNVLQPQRPAQQAAQQQQPQKTGLDKYQSLL
jgi:SCY1-like protein 2